MADGHTKSEEGAVFLVYRITPLNDGGRPVRLGSAHQRTESLLVRLTRSSRGSIHPADGLTGWRQTT